MDPNQQNQPSDPTPPRVPDPQADQPPQPSLPEEPGQIPLPHTPGTTHHPTDQPTVAQPQPVSPPSPSPVQQVEFASPKKSHHKKVIVVAIAFVILLVGATVYVFTSGDDSDTPTSSNNSQSQENSPTSSESELEGTLAELVEIDKESFRSLTANQRDAIRVDVVNVIYYALEQTYKAPPHLFDIDDTADNYLRDYHDGFTGDYRDMFSAFSISGGDISNCQPSESTELSARYDDESGTIGVFGVCLESGEGYQVGS